MELNRIQLRQVKTLQWFSGIASTLFISSLMAVPICVLLWLLLSILNWMKNGYWELQLTFCVTFAIDCSRYSQWAGLDIIVTYFLNLSLPISVLWIAIALSSVSFLVESYCIAEIKKLKQ